MRPSWIYSLLVGGVLLFSFSACDDASTVGLGVGPDSLSGGDPVTLDIPPALDTTTSPPQTGLELQPFSPFGNRGPWRVLVGRVDDPIGGTIEANGYFDVQGRSDLPPEILNADPDSLSAELRFTPTYIHGDTASSVEFRVLNLSEEAKMDQARADTTFPVGSAIARRSIVPTDSLVTIDLPSSWLTSERLGVLRDTSDGGSAFNENFHGFKLVAAEESAVVGFSVGNATLRLIHTPDSTTADFPGLKAFTHVERRNVPDFPNHQVLQGGVGVGLTMNWDFNAPPLDTLNRAPLNRAEIFVPIDTSAMEARSGSDSFARPLPKGYRVTAVRDQGSTVCSRIQTVFPLPQNDTRCALPILPQAIPGAALVPNRPAFPIFETSLRQTPAFTRYRVEVADRETSPSRSETVQPGLPSTLPVLVPLPEAEDIGSPHATLTVTPL